MNPDFKRWDAFGPLGNWRTGVSDDQRKRILLASGISSGQITEKYTVFSGEILCLQYLIAGYFRGKLNLVNVEKKGRDDLI
jgi:hypothetical protein